MNGEIFAAADELHEKFRLGGVFVFAVVGRIERHRLEVAPKPLEEFVVKTVDVVTGRLKLLEKTLPTIERVLPLVLMEVEPDAEEFKGLVDAAESPFEVEFGLFVAFDDVFPTPDGVVVARCCATERTTPVTMPSSGCPRRSQMLITTSEWFFICAAAKMWATSCSV